MRSVMSHSFAQTPSVKVPRSSFDRSHGHKTTFSAGDLIPVYVDEALPGDTFNMRTFMFGRMATPLYPIMDNLYMDVHYFAVPLRMIWDNHAKFMGERLNPADSIDYEVPIADKTVAPLSTTGYLEDSLHDYMGLPPGIVAFDHSNLPFRAYNKCYADWYRDANLIDSPVIDTDDGPDDPADYTILKRGKRHDYFTSALPWLQRGDALSIPLGSSAPITHDGSGTGDLLTVKAPNIGVSDYNMNAGGSYLADSNNTSGATRVPLYADLSNATAATINQLRQAFQIQKLLERDARGGTGRLHEIIQSHFGVASLDQRATKSEYLGGTTSMLNVNPVTTTADPTAAVPRVGDQGAFVTVSESGGGFTKSFTEHCIILGIASIRADLTYQQGLDRMFSRSTRYDYFWPVLSSIGEQSLLNKEIYLQGSAGGTDDDDVFGYSPRYEEYRCKNSRISSAFRSSATAPLDAWHLSQEFASLPTLSQTFIEETPPISRVIATPTDPEFICDFFFNLRCARPMPMFGVPGLIDHL